MMVKMKKLKGFLKKTAPVVAALVLSLLVVSKIHSETVTGKFAVELKEWVVLEIVTPGFRVENRGQNLAGVLTEVFLGQPVEIRALLSVESGKGFYLKGRLYDLETMGIKETITWTGTGDITGNGPVNPFEENIFAVWYGPALKSGSITFSTSSQAEEGKPRRFGAYFTLSAL